MKKNYKKNNYNKIQKFSIRKYSFGAASVAIASYLMFMGNGAVFADEATVSENTAAKTEEVVTTEKPNKEESPKVVETAEEKAQKELVASKEKLANYVKEIEGNLSSGKYESKTEESLALLRDAITEANQAANATTTTEVEKAYANLITTVNAKLKSKPTEKKETPAVDTTNGKETVGKKAENTEKKSDSNSIENTGSKDSRNGKVLDKNTAFRAETDTEKPTVEIPFSNGKDVYVYGAESEGFDIKIKDNSGFIANATVKKGGNQNFNAATGEPGKLDAQYGYTVNQITTKTEASESNPAVIHYTGLPGGELRPDQLEAAKTNGLTLGWRFVTATDEAGNFIENKAAGPAINTDPGSFNVIVKPQTYKYSIQQPEIDGNKIGVDDINNLSATDITKIKNKINIEYSKDSQDARFESKKGQALENKDSVVSSIDVNPTTKVITVTYKDGSTDTATISSVVRTNQVPTVSIPYSDPTPDKKDIYIYNGEEVDIDITFNDDSGKIQSAALKRGGNIALRDIGENKQDNEWGLVTTVIKNETTTPATIKITGTVTGLPDNKIPKTESQELPIVSRFATATDLDGKFIENQATKFNAGTNIVSESYKTDPGAFTITLKAQTAKYDIKTPASADKVTVSDANNISNEDFEKIKAKVKIEYSNNNIDMRLADKKGTEVENPTERVERIEREGNNVVVTYKDGSKDTKALADFVNVAPKVALPYSNEANKQIYVYTGENTDLTFKGTDENEVKDLYLRGPGDISGNNAAGYGLPTGKVENGEVTGEGSVSEDKRTATIKMTGTTNLAAGKEWTSFIVSKDNDGTLSNTDYRALDKDPNAKEKPGYVRFVVKNQTSKYDIAAPTEKVAVTDPANVTEDDLAKIKEKLQLEYNKKNDDANISKDSPVTDKDSKIKSLTKDADGNLVVTYKDGSTDKRPLSEFVTLDKQPAIDAVKKAAEAQITAINNTPNATDEEKQVAIDKVNADKKKALDEIAKPEVTTKEAVDAAKTAGTTAIAGDNPVVAKKDAAKADVETARKAKEDAIKANPNLTQTEKDAAIAKNNTAAAEATKAIDSATTNDAVDQAKTAGTGEIAKVNPVAKEAAKKAIADELANKEEVINGRTDLTDEEKAAAKKDAQDKAKAATDAINAQPDNAETPEKAAEAQTAVDTAKKTGVDEVSAVNPVAAKKPEAKKAVDDALKAKVAAIDAREDLTPEEKQTAKDKAAEEAKKATDAIDAATTDAAVDTAKTAGTGEIAKVNPVAKTKAKDEIAKELAKKEEAIDARTDLTDAEKAKAKEDAKAKAKEATDSINAQPDNAETPEKAAEAQTAVDGAKDKGVADVKAVNPVAKEAAKKAIADELAKKEEAINGRTDLTDEEKAAAKKDAQDKAKAATDAINAQPDNAETPEKAAEAQTAVDTAKKTGVDEVSAVNPVAAKKPEAKKAVDDALKAKVAAIDAREDLTPEEKQTAKDKAAEEAKKATDAIEAATTDAAVDTAKTAGTGEIAKVNPVAKTKAKDEIAKELAKKEEAIDARTDLTDAEKAKAKEDAKAKAKEATDSINAQPDNAETPEKAAEAQTAVDGAKDKGVADVKAVNPVAKEAAKKAIADELAKKEEAINGRTDLTDEEKAAAKKDAQDKAKEATDAIDAQPSNAETPEEAEKAQTAVNGAKDKGVADVKAVDPAAAKKPEAKKAVEDALKAKVAAIDAREDLTPAEKQTAKDKAAEEAKKAKEAIDAATTDAAVDTAKTAGTGEIAKVNPVAKTKAKDEIAKELAKKEEAIDARTDLTDEEKAAAKKDAQDKAKEATDAINAQPDNAETPEKAAEAQTAVDGAKDKGVTDVKAVNPEAKAKPEAKKAIDDKLAKQLEDIANTPDATDEEKKVAADAAKALADQAKKDIDNAKKDEDVKKLQDEAKDEIEKSVPVVEDKPNARKAIEDEAKAKKEAIDARTDLTPKAKEDLKAEVDAIADQAKKAVDKATSATDVDKIEEADKAAIKAVGEVKEPVDKILVKDPAKLTDAEKAKLLEEVKKVNPTAKEVKYDEDGNIEVTTQNGDKGTIKPADIVKTEDDLDNGKGGNNINKPIDKVIVKDPANLTDAEKAKIVDEVKAVNPNSIVTIDDKGTVTVSTPDGEIAAIPAVELVRTKEDTAKPDAGNSKVVKPADKVVGEATDPVAQAKVEEKLKDLNPTAKSVKFDEKGNATVTLNDGTTATIPAKDLFKSPEEATKPNAGNDIVKPADKTVVANPNQLTDAEKKLIEDKVKAVNPGATVVVDDKGNATVTTPEGKTAVIPATDLVKSPEEATKPNAGNDIVKPADKTVAANPEKLTDAEKKAIEDKVKAVNPGATVVVDDKGNATVTTPEGKTAVIPATDLVKSPEEATKPNAGNDIVKPADKTVAANPEKLTDVEKKAIEDKVKAVNPGVTVVVDDKGNATVTTPEGKTAVIPATDLVKSPEEATKPNAGNDIVKPADKTVAANPEKLTDAEKKAIEDKVKAVNPGSTVVVDDKGNATVTTPEGKTAVIPATDLVKSPEEATKPNAGNDIVKPADKTVAANPEKLTDAEKKAIEDKVKAVNPGATVVVDDKGNATVTTPEGKTAVIPATDLVKSPEEATKPNAGNDIVKPADKTVAANPEKLTDAEKKAIEDKVKAVNPGATVVVDDKGNATVTTPEGKTAVIPATDLVKSPEEATKPNAGNDIVKPADKTVAANPEKLTDAEKKAIEDKVKAVNPGATVVVDDKGNATVTTPEGKTAVIPATDLVKSPEEATKPNAGNDIVKPASKTVVANPDALTPEEKKAIEDKVKAVNPGSTVVVDDKGNATVTTPEGKTAVIPATDLTKSSADAAKPNAGNDIAKPADKTVVANPDALTSEEKKAIEDKVKAVNPGSTVVVDDKGNATVTTPEGKTAVIPATDLVKSKEDAAKPNAGNDIAKPADKTVVANPDALTPEEKKAIEDKVKAVNPGSTVVVDDKGNATVTTPEGKTAVIPATDLVKSKEDAAKPNAGNDIAKPADKTVVANPDALTPEEKKAIEDKVKAVNPGSTVVVDDKGNATVTTPEGKTAVIPATDLVKSKEDAAKPNAGNDIAKPADKTVVANPDALTPEEKKAIEDKVKAVNPGSTVVVDDKGNATVTTPEGKTAVIPATDLVKSQEDAAKPNAGNDIAKPADKTVVANPDALTSEEKKAIEDKVKAVNPGSTVVVDDKGNATVTTPEGKTAVIPATDLVKSKEDAAKPNAGNDIVKPASKTVVANPDALTPEEKKAIEDKVKAVNPGSTVVVDDKGNATVTTLEGKTAVIPATDLTKSSEDVRDDIVKPADKTVVANPNQLTDAEKKAIEEKVKAVNPGATVVVDDKGNATVTTPEGKTAVIPASDLTKKAEISDVSSNNAGSSDRVNTPNSEVSVDKAKLNSEILQLEELVVKFADKLSEESRKETQTLLAEAKDVFNNPKATQAEVDAIVKRIEELKAKLSTIDNSGERTADNQTTAQSSTTKASTGSSQKELPNTGTSTLGTVLPAIAALLSGVGVFATKKKEDE